MVGCSNRTSTPSDQGTTGEGFSKVNREQGETTEKGGNSAEIPAPGSAPSEGEAADKIALDFDDVKTPVEAMERFTFNEGYVVIPWDQLADNNMQIEEFIKNYPDSPEYEKVKELYQRELNSYLGGTYGDQVQQDLRESYCRFLDRYKGSDTCAIVKEFYYLLEQNDFKKTEQIDDFLKRVKQ